MVFEQISEWSKGMSYVQIPEGKENISCKESSKSKDPELGILSMFKGNSFFSFSCSFGTASLVWNISHLSSSWPAFCFLRTIWEMAPLHVHFFRFYPYLSDAWKQISHKDSHQIHKGIKYQSFFIINIYFFLGRVAAFLDHNVQIAQVRY